MYGGGATGDNLWSYILVGFEITASMKTGQRSRFTRTCMNALSESINLYSAAHTVVHHCL